MGSTKRVSKRAKKSKKPYYAKLEKDHKYKTKLFTLLHRLGLKHIPPNILGKIQMEEMMQRMMKSFHESFDSAALLGGNFPTGISKMIDDIIAKEDKK